MNSFIDALKLAVSDCCEAHKLSVHKARYAADSVCSRLGKGGAYAGTYIEELVLGSLKALKYRFTRH